MSSEVFEYERLIQFYETDAMGIVHHANYIYLMEEARLHFLRLLFNGADGNYLADCNYPVLSCHMDYKKPLHFNDRVCLKYTAQTQGQRLVFNYEFWTKSIDKPLAFGKTEHAAFDMQKGRAIKLPEKLLSFLSRRE